jgi:Fe-S-cluster containining protein
VSLVRAAAFARAGGHAVIWAPARRSPAAWLLMPCTKDGLPLLSRWVLVLLGRRTYGEVQVEPAKGLALIKVARRFHPRLAAWCHRDSHWRAATRPLTLDCMSCGACCHNCRPALLPPDLTRWRKADRADLGAGRYVRRIGGQLVIRLRPADHGCVHLDGRRCGIYPLRPYACRIFPPGCESCLGARRAVFGIVDGAPPEC